MPGDLYNPGYQQFGQGMYGQPQTGYQRQRQQVFPTMGDQRPGTPSISGPPQQGQGTPAPNIAPQAPQGQQQAIQQAQQQPQQQQAAQPQQTFRQMQMNGQARPAPPPPPPPAQPSWPQPPSSGYPQSGYGYPQGGYPNYGQGPTPYNPQVPNPSIPQGQGVGFNGVSGYTNPLDAQLRQSIQGRLAQPTAYDSNTIQGMYQAGLANIDNQAKLAQQGVDAEMAARGLFSSTPAAGRLGDIQSNRLLAIADLQNNLLNQRAQAADAGQQAATGQAMNYGAAGLQNVLGVGGLNLQGAQLGAQIPLAYAQMQFQGGQNAADRSLQAQQFGANLGEQGRQFNAGLGLNYAQLGQNNNQYLGNLGLNYAQLQNNANQWQGNLGLNYAQLGEQGRQFDQGFGLAQNAQNWNQLNDLYGLYGNSNLAQTGYDPNAALSDLYGGPGGAVQPNQPPLSLQDLQQRNPEQYAYDTSVWR